MTSDFINRINKFIAWSFYILFFLTPLLMWPDTFELFEFNKMWHVFGMTLLIGFLWFSKMILQGKFEIRRTPLDIPIALFLVSQIISTLFSMDPHVSFWGYYSRFNGGLLSTISYIFLYYAFATNLAVRNSVNGDDARIGHDKRQTSNHTGFLTDKRSPISYSLLTISLLSGLAVTLWGLPSHFGYDPTCFMFRGTLDVTCWTESFQPTIRIFSTLGQPNWMGTYLAALIPVALGFAFYKLKEPKLLVVSGYLSVAVLFYLALLYTRSQSSFVGLTVGLLVFTGFFVFKYFRSKSSLKLSNSTFKFGLIFIAVFAVTTFLTNTPVASLNKYITLSGWSTMFSKPAATSDERIATSPGLESSTDIQLGGTESSTIRLIVWQGAIELFKRNPIFGTGVETFAYAYYQVKPQSHNLTSEWDYLYNKAHNEYLNYLATTGAFGLISYLSIIGLFYFYSLKYFLKKQHNDYFPVSLGLTAGFTSIIISNFFGFSVVIINLFFFIFPILFFELTENKTLNKTFSSPKNAAESLPDRIPPPKMISIILLGLIALYYEFFLFNFWSADRKYALGNNLNRASEYVTAYQPLTDAVKMLPQEDLYKDELSINMATLSLLLAEQGEATQAAQLGQQAKLLSDGIISKHPNNIVYLKTRARVAFALSEIDPDYLNLAIQTLEDARKLAPTDAKILYNEGLFYNQLGNTEKALEYINLAIKLKPNYLDAYYTRALIYKEKDPQKARESLNYILEKIDPNHKASQELLDSL